jgi:peroxiredoxin
MAGPTFSTWKELPVQVGDPAPMLEVVDAGGQAFPLKTAWARGPALVLFLRHFSCSCTRRRVERLATEVERYTALGVSVVAIGQGEPERTRVFAADHNVPVPVLCDPERKAYRAFGVLEGRAPQIISTNALDGDKGLQYADKLLGEGRSLVDSPWQLGAEFVINGAGVIAVAHRYQVCDDFPSVESLAAAMEKLAQT